MALPPLLLTESLQDARGGCAPLLVKRASIASWLPIAVGQSDRIAERVDLPLALAHTGQHIGIVVDGPGEGRVGGVAHESVGVWIDEDASALPADHTFDKRSKLAVLARKG